MARDTADLLRRGDVGDARGWQELDRVVNVGVFGATRKITDPLAGHLEIDIDVARERCDHLNALGTECAGDVLEVARGFIVEQAEGFEFQNPDPVLVQNLVEPVVGPAFGLQLQVLGAVVADSVESGCGSR